jgi:adenosylcobinamide-GDP ribazoletransferase
VAGAVVLAVDALVTAGLHLDAVADVADAFGSRRSATEAKAIMREATIGALGAAALVIVLMVRFVFLATLISEGSWSALMVVPVTGRAAMVWSLGRARRLEPDSIAAGMSRAASPGIVALALLSAACIGALGRGPGGLVALVVATAAAEAWTRSFERRFAGLTGDGIGAAGMLGEIAALGVLAARAV